MTERKPAGMSFTSWIDQQISEAAERGAFDNLPGAGKPLPNRGDADDGQAWLREYARREGVAAEELLPTPLRLRKQIHRLTEEVGDLRSEQDVRDAAGELNRQVREWRRIPLGPPVFVPLVDEDDLVSRWRDSRDAASAQSGSPAAATGAGPGPGSPGPGSSGPPAAAPTRQRWWLRRRNRRPA